MVGVRRYHFRRASIPFRLYSPNCLEQVFSEVRDYFFLFTSSCSMRSLISSRTLRKTASRSSSEPSAREGSSKDQCSLFLAPGKNGQASLASSQTVIT